MRDRFAVDQERAAVRVVATWDDETLAGDIPALSSRLFRATGVDPLLAAKLYPRRAVQPQDAGMSALPKRISVELHPQTYDALLSLAGGHYPEPDDVARYLILRSLADLVKAGVAEARHNETVISAPPERRPVDLGRRPLPPGADGRIWCAQCERRVATDQAACCASPWCKAVQG